MRMVSRLLVGSLVGLVGTVFACSAPPSRSGDDRSAVAANSTSHAMSVAVALPADAAPAPRPDGGKSEGGPGNHQCNPVELNDCMEAECEPLKTVCPGLEAGGALAACLIGGATLEVCAEELAGCALVGLAYGPACVCCLKAACNDPC